MAKLKLHPSTFSWNPIGMLHLLAVRWCLRRMSWLIRLAVTVQEFALYCCTRIKYYSLWRRDADNRIFTLDRPTFFPSLPSFEFFDHGALERVHTLQRDQWTADEISLEACQSNWKTRLSAEARNVYKQVFAFFAIGNGIVCDVLSTLIAETKVPELKAFYVTQVVNETVHAEVYGRVPQVLLKDVWEQYSITQDILHSPPLVAKCEWVQKYSKPGTPFTVRCMLALIIEQLWFSYAFSLINVLRKNNLMAELVKLNDFVGVDKWRHCDNHSRILLEYFDFENRADLQAVFWEMAEGAYAAEMVFVEHVVVKEETAKADGVLSYFTRDHLVNELQAAYDFMLELMNLPPKYINTQTL